MRVAIGSDHVGLELKTAMTGFLADAGHDVLDVGTFSAEPVDYVDCADAVTSALRDSRAERGIVVCGSGVGGTAAANRVPGIRAGLCHDAYSARQGVEHEDMNVLVLGGHVVGIALAEDVVSTFLTAKFDGEGRHRRHLEKMRARENPLRALRVFGQAVWLDYLRRGLMTSGELHRMIDEDGVSGVSCNPAIFANVTAGSSDYQDGIRAPWARSVDTNTLFETLVVRDVQDAADALRAVYEDSSRRDGYVSVDMSPLVAHDTVRSQDEARRLWNAAGRDNLMIKIPATAEGIAAIPELVGRGINVNATLLFSVAAFEQVACAYFTGLEHFVARGGDPAGVASVASVFISRIDTAIDAKIDKRLPHLAPGEQTRLRGISGKVAVASARLIYQRYRELYASPRWCRLAALGAQTQRLLWASTGTQNVAHRDVMYVEELIGPDTVAAIAPATLDAFRDHGQPRASLQEDSDAATDTMELLSRHGISMDEVTNDLLTDGVHLSVRTFQQLLRTIDERREAVDAGIDAFAYTLPAPIEAAVKRAMADWRGRGKVRRLWARDASLWTGTDEGRWLGWLGLANNQTAHINHLTRDFTDVVVLGMGGSSLGPQAMSTLFRRTPGYPELHVLDSTDPAQVEAIAHRVDLNKTLFVVSSKSGSALETNILKEYFFDRVSQVVGAEHAGRQFIAITDPDSSMHRAAEADSFRHIFFEGPHIAGPYSALSDCGLVPLAIMGVNVERFVSRTGEMVHACMPTVPIDENPGVVLGVVLGVAAHFGRDKLTIVSSPAITHIGAWVEQLVAESTGKNGHGVVPIDREALGSPETYGPDRLFVYMRFTPAPDATQDDRVNALQKAGHAVVRIGVSDAYALGQEFFRWQIATAVAASILGVHPFDQPDVGVSRIATRRLIRDYERVGRLAEEVPLFSGDGVALFADEKNAVVLAARVSGDCTLRAYLKAHLDRLDPGDYFALLAYIQMNAGNDHSLQAMRHQVRDAKRVATCAQFGPRFLHTAGQLYKGGPNTGVFLQITCDDGVDLTVPGKSYSFGVVKAAQARADFEVLVERNRRALRIHLGVDVAAGLATLHDAVRGALSSNAMTFV